MKHGLSPHPLLKITNKFRGWWVPRRPGDVGTGTTEAKRRPHDVRWTSVLGRRSLREDLEPWVKSPSASENKKSPDILSGDFSFSCGWWDLNPHDRETGRF